MPHVLDLDMAVAFERAAFLLRALVCLLPSALPLGAAAYRLGSLVPVVPHVRFTIPPPSFRTRLDAMSVVRRLFHRTLLPIYMFVGVRGA